MRFARTGPMPLISPDARYFSMPFSERGAMQVSVSALNWRPCTLSVTHCPSALTSSPSQTACALPTIVISGFFASSNSLGISTCRTVYPFSSLWNTTERIVPSTISLSEHLSDAFNGKLDLFE